MNGYALGVYEKAMPDELSWENRLSAARQAGYDFLELSIDETDQRLSRLDLSGQELKEISDSVAKTELPIRSMCLSAHRKYPLGSSDPETVRRGMEIMAKAIKLADRLGIRIIMLAGYDVYYEEASAQTRQRFSDNLADCVDMAARFGIILAFETMETPFMNTVEKAVSFVRANNSPYLQVYPDIGNITNAGILQGTDTFCDLQSGAGHLVGLHLKESAPNVFRNMKYGEGHVDFERAVKEAWRLGIRRYVTEFWYLGGDRWMEELQDACGFARKLLDKECLRNVKRA